jgi:diguanylate cyclase (GGDEF)-like protein/PAS domain S-box-containing protein
MPYQDSQVITRLLLNSTFSAIQIQDPEGKTIYSGGRFMKHPLSTIPLDFPYGAQLLWKNGFRLQLSTTLHHAGKIHTLMLQWPLQTFNQFFPSTKDFNGQPTLLCFLNNIQKLTCLPPQTNLQLLSASLSTHEWQELLRLTQQSLPGIIKNSSRSQKNSLLIYSPLGQQKIGLVIKPDLEEMYRPLRKELFWVILVLLLAISFGAFLLYWRVSPLVRKLYENEAQLQSAFTYSAIGMAMVSPEGYWLKVNSALCQILGYTEAEFLKMNFQSITYPADLSSSLEKTKQALSRKIDHYTLAKRYFHKNGQLVWALLHVSLIRNAAQHPLYFIAQIQDITEQKQFQEKLNYQAYYDTLTGLANRSLLEHELHQLITTCQKNNKQFAVLFMDLDYFKKVNDSLGHDAGDQLLVSVAERLKSYARKTDIVARLGGDEFVVVLPEIDDYRAAAAFAEKIRLLVVNPFIIRGRELFITASFGISFYPLDGNSYATLIKNADQALYQAKERGRNNYQFCDPERSVTLQGNNF